MNEGNENTPEAVRARVVRKLQTETLEAAVAGLTRVLTDAKSPAPAVATAGVAVLRSNGLLQEKGGGGAQKELHEMTADELHEHIAKMEARRREMETAMNEGADDEEGGSVFD